MQNVVALPISYVTLNKMNPLSDSPIQPSAATTMDKLGQAPLPGHPYKRPHLHVHVKPSLTLCFWVSLATPIKFPLPVTTKS